MQRSFEELTAEVMDLSPPQRAELAERIAHSLDSSPDDEVTRAWIAECERRLDELDSGKVQAIPGEQVMEEVRRMLKR